jgi:hypothetical protein
MYSGLLAIRTPELATLTLKIDQFLVFRNYDGEAHASFSRN